VQSYYAIIQNVWNVSLSYYYVYKECVKHIIFIIACNFAFLSIYFMDEQIICERRNIVEMQFLKRISIVDQSTDYQVMSDRLTRLS